MNYKKRLALLLVALLPLLLPAPLFGQGSDIPRFEQTNCPFRLPQGQVEGETVDCGYVLVPENRANPDSQVIRLALAIFHPPDGATEPDPIIYLEGGPGGSPLTVRTLQDISAFLEPAFTLGRDLLVFDQRGVGYSEPALNCPDFSALYLDLYDQEIDGQSVTVDESLALKVDALAACAENLRDTADLTAYNTAENAADVNDIRIALGYDMVNLWGTSYGTRLALDVMRDFPEGIRAVVLDAPYTADADAYLEMPGNFKRAMNVVIEQCAAEAACNAAYPHLGDVLLEAVAHLDENPVLTNVRDVLTGDLWPVLVDGDTFQEQLFRALYDTGMRPYLPQIIFDAREGTLDTILAITQFDVIRQHFRSWGMYFSVLCHDEVPFSTLDDFEAVASEYPEYAGFLRDFEIGPLPYLVCEQWDAGTADDRENESVASDIPALVMTGIYDPIVVPEWGSEAARSLPNGHFYLFPGVGHGASLIECPKQIMLSFIEDPAAPPDDSCIETMPIEPFVVPSAEPVEVSFEPFSVAEYGLEGVRPAGWTEVALGAYARLNTAADPVAFLVETVPLSAPELLEYITARAELGASPERLRQVEANGLVWDFYQIELQGITMDLVLAENATVTYFVQLYSTGSEHDALYEAVLLPAIDALRPVE